MSKVKNQHYVPRRYLKNFAELTKKKGIYRLNVFDKVTSKARYNQNIENIASERYFYDVNFEELIEEAIQEGIDIPRDKLDEIKSVDVQSMEKILSETEESVFFNPIGKIITSYIMSNPNNLENIIAIIDSDRPMIAYYLAIQFVRTKEFKTQLIQLTEKGTELIAKKQLKDKVSNDFIENLEINVKENMKSLLHNEYMLDTELLGGIAKSFLSHIWFVAVSRDRLFWTSDTPIVRYGYLEKMGFESEGIEIIFPITSELALVMHEASYFLDEFEKHLKFVRVSKSFVEHCNALQVVQSYRNVFTTERDFSIAERIIKLNSNIGNVSRSRFLMG